MAIIPNSQRTHEQLSEMGRKGGIKSGETRRRNTEMRRKFLLMQVDRTTIQQLSAEEIILFREWRRQYNK